MYGRQAGVPGLPLRARPSTGGPTAAPWKTLGYDNRRSGHNPSGWLSWPAESGLFARTKHSVAHEPALVDGVAYFGSREHDDSGVEGTDGPSGLRAVDRSGEEWFYRERDTLASPTVVGNAIFVTSEERTVALGRRNGDLCWGFRAGRGIPAASPTVADGSVYVTGDRLFALVATTGEVQWATDRLVHTPGGTAATSDGVFATASSPGGGAVYRFDPETGETVWSEPTDSSVLAPPVLGPIVYVVETDGQLRTLDPADGTGVWSRDLGDRASALPAVAEGTVYVVAPGDDTLRAFDAVTGAVDWQFSFDGRQATGPTVGRTSVYFPVRTKTGGVVPALAARTGAVRESHELPRQPATPLVLGAKRGLISTSSFASTTRLSSLEPASPGAAPE